MTVADDRIAQALTDTLISPNECDRNLENANVVDGLYEVSRAIRGMGDAVTPHDAIGVNDGMGGYVTSLTEAVMSVANALKLIADAISERHD
jgi:hypothetical protein